MDILYPILFNSSVLIAAAVTSFFWFIGGTTGLVYAFPKKAKGKKYRPSKILLFITTAVLAGMTLLCLGQTGTFNSVLSEESLKWGNRLIGIVFLARSIGSFKYVGFTKTSRNSEFATTDTYLISPLCLVIALIQFYLTSYF